MLSNRRSERWHCYELFLVESSIQLRRLEKFTVGPAFSNHTARHDENLFSGGERAAVPSCFSGRPVLVFIGSLKPWHGIEFLLDKLKETKTNSEFFDAMKRS